MTKASNLGKGGSNFNTSGQLDLTTGVTGVLPVANGGTGSSSGVSPGGSTTQVQYNSSGAFGGDSGFVYTGGSVGIGTTSPSSKLTIGRFDSSSEGGQVDLCRASDNANAWGIDVYGSTSTPSLRILDNTAAAARMVIDGTGNVGVNNNSPAVLSSTTQVAVKANVSADAMFVAQNSNGLTTAKFGFQFTGSVDNPVIGSYTNHPFLFLTNNTERMRIAPTGEVGIGTNAPSGTLNVAGATNTSTNTLNLSGTGTGGNYAFIQNTTGRLAIGVESNSGSTIITGAGANEVSLSAKNTAINFSVNNGSTIAAKIDNSYMFYMNSGYGSAAIAYGTRLWVNFNGANGAIRGSGGVSSVSRTGTGAYTVNYSITLPDSNYAATCGGGDYAGGDVICTGVLSTGSMGTTSIQLLSGLTGGSGGRRDPGLVCLVITR